VGEKETNRCKREFLRKESGKPELSVAVNEDGLEINNYEPVETYAKGNQATARNLLTVQKKGKGS